MTKKNLKPQQAAPVQRVRPLVDKRWYNQVSTGNPY
jgi:prenylated cyclic peptide (anacyclamide/piricyclamide family)